MLDDHASQWIYNSRITTVYEFMSFPDSRCVYWSIHGHATPLSDPETEARSGIMVKCPLGWVRYAHVVESAA